MSDKMSDNSASEESKIEDSFELVSQSDDLDQKIEPIIASLEKLGVKDIRGTTKLEKPLVWGISKAGYPKQSVISGEEERLIHQVLLDRLIMLNDYAIPSFKLFRLFKGMIIIVCEDYWTAEWVIITVRGMTDFCYQLCVFDAERMFTLDVALVLPLVLKDIPYQKILKAVSLQNRGMLTDRWKFLTAYKGKTGNAIILRIDVGSLRYIKRKNFILNLGLGKAYVKFPYDEGVKDVSRTKKPQSGHDKIPQHGWLITQVLKYDL